MLKESLYFHDIDNGRRFVAVRKARPGEQMIHAGGKTGDVIRFLSESFLKDPETWKLFVQQFRFNSDGDKRGWRCEYWGKMMRGAAYVCAVTKDCELYGILKETVEDLLSAQDSLGRFSSYAPEKEFNGWDMWGRKYVLLGMLRFLDICDDESLKDRIIAALTRHAEYISRHIGPESEGKLPISKTSQLYHAINSLSILEPIVLLYEITKNQELLAFADYLVTEGYKQPDGIFFLADENKLYPYQYPVTKAYEMISCFEGLLEYARITGSAEKKQTAVNFAYSMLDAEISVIGSAGCMHEFLDHSNSRQTSFFYSGVKQETCVTVTWMKFCARMFVATGDPLFADAFEQSLENAYFGAVNTEKNINADQVSPGQLMPGIGLIPRVLPFDSYSPLLRGLRGKGLGGAQVMTSGDYYGCCACIGAAGAGIAPQLAVLPSDSGFAINLYSDIAVQTKTPSENRVAVLITGGYPINGDVRIVVSTETPEEFDVSLRIPAWSKKTSITCGRTPSTTEDVEVTPGMTTIHRVWEGPVVINISFDMSIEVLRPLHYGTDSILTPGATERSEDVETPQNHAFAALRRGPIMLARDARLDEGFDPVRLDAETGDRREYKTASATALPFPARCRIKIKDDDGNFFTVIDYSSAGATWDNNSECEVWIPKA